MLNNNTRVFLKSDIITNQINVHLANSLNAKGIYIESISVPNTYYNLTIEDSVSWTDFSGSHSILFQPGNYNLITFMTLLINAMIAFFPSYSYQVINNKIQILNPTTAFSVVVNNKQIANFLGALPQTGYTSIITAGVNVLSFPNVYNFQRTNFYLIQSNINFNGSYTSYDNIVNNLNTQYNNILFVYPNTGDSGQIINQYIGQFAQSTNISKLANTMQLILLDDNLLPIDLNGLNWCISIIFIL